MWDFQLGVKSYALYITKYFIFLGFQSKRLISMLYICKKQSIFYKYINCYNYSKGFYAAKINRK